ncbi:hypothetical protein LCGC14_2988510 [marine sediment metagenome]|uniref:Uncharacterized protein n=1 Tax=marine sediment metagenome TaxID=412755 RepID=A0A0F8X4L9_9ZZZZ
MKMEKQFYTIYILILILILGINLKFRILSIHINNFFGYKDVDIKLNLN